MIVFIRVALNYVFTDVELHHLDDILPPFRTKNTVDTESPKKAIYKKVAADEEKQVQEGENEQSGSEQENEEEEEQYEKQELNFHLESDNKK